MSTLWNNHISENKPTGAALLATAPTLFLKVSLRKLADDYQMKADELENDEISALANDDGTYR